MPFGIFIIMIDVKRDFLIEGSINNLITIILINIEQIKKIFEVKMKKFKIQKCQKKF